MPGTWTPTQATAADQRPGLYANFTSKAAALVTAGIKGIVAMAVTADWGPANLVQRITSEQELRDFYSTSTGGTVYYGVSEALRGGAKEVLVYRMVTAAGAAATRALLDATAGTAITLTAKYRGSRANNFTVTVQTNTVDAAKKDVILYESGVELERFTGGTNAELVAAINATDGTGSKYMTAVAGGGTFAANVTGSAFAGGNSGTAVTGAEYTAAMNALEPNAFDTFAAQGVTDTAIWTSLKSWATGLRTAGQRFMLVLGGAAAETLATAKTNASTYGNHEGVVYVWPGVTDHNNVARSGAEFAGRVAALIARYGIEESLTHEPVTDIKAVASAPTNADVKSGLASGLFMITGDGRGSFRVEKGINTLTTLGANQTAQNKKIRVVRILDAINNDLTNSATSFIGIIENNATGRGSVVAAIKAYLDTLVQAGLIEDDFTVEEDPGNPATGDRMYVLLGIKPVDTIDYVYLTVSVAS